MALNPAVDWLQSRGIHRRGIAVGMVFVSAVLAVIAVGALFVPTLVREVNDFAEMSRTTSTTSPRTWPPRFPSATTRSSRRCGRRSRRAAPGCSALEHGPGGDEERRQRGRRRAHHLLPDPVHADRGPDLGRAHLLTPARHVPAALAQRRPADLPHGRRLRNRQPGDQLRRRSHLDDRSPGARSAVRRRARVARGDSRPDPARGRDDRRNRRLDRRLPPPCTRESP